jgi:signal transduction histidine kinase
MANVSHELRTPLNAVIGYSELLIENAEERGAPEEAGDNRKVLEAALKLRGMVNDVLKLAAIDAGKTPIEEEECLPAEMAEEAVDALAPLLASTKNRVEIADTTTPGAWITDGEKLSACIRNLIANAAHCSQDGKIALRLSENKSRSQLVIEIVDDGPHIAPKQVELLFEPFAQPEIAGARHYEGMALNLALTRRLARLLGGELSVSSDASGANFRLEIPARRVGAPSRPLTE